MLTPKFPPSPQLWDSDVRQSLVSNQLLAVVKSFLALALVDYTRMHMHIIVSYHTLPNQCNDTITNLSVLLAGCLL